MTEHIRGERRREQIVDFIRDFYMENGYPPTLSEISKGVGLSDGSVVKHHIDRLAATNRLTYKPRIARSIMLI